jgi:hypothetical protein
MKQFLAPKLGMALAHSQEENRAFVGVLASVPEGHRPPKRY